VQLFYARDTILRCFKSHLEMMMELTWKARRCAAAAALNVCVLQSFEEMSATIFPSIDFFFGK